MDNQLRCQNCDALLEPHWKLCPECHYSTQPKKCWNCGQMLKEGWERCPACGETTQGARERQGEYDRAIADFAKAIKLVPSDEDIQEALSTASKTLRKDRRG